MTNLNLNLSNCRMNRTPIKIVAGLFHPGHRLDERDLRLDREGRHEGGARAGHEISREFPGAALAAQVDEGGAGGGRRRDGHVQAVLLLLEGERRDGQM